MNSSRLESTLRPLVAFVILNWNQGKMTLECLDSLKKQDYSRFLIVVVDNGSTDGSQTLIRDSHPDVTLIEVGENLGYSLGNNVGIQHALQTDAQYVFLLNNDTVVDRAMLGKLVRVAESDPQIGMVGPTMLYFDPPNLLWGGVNRINWQRGRMIRVGMGNVVPEENLKDQAVEETDYVDTCAILVRRRVYEKVGLMDDDYFINYDDLDWNVRARQAGFKIVYVPAARMWHKVSAAMGLASPATTYYMTRNALLFFWRYAPGIWKFLAPLQIVWRTVYTIAAWTLKPKYRPEIFRRKRDANVLALRDFMLVRFGKMGGDVARICYGR